jgi:predicted secreted protein
MKKLPLMIWALWGLILVGLVAGAQVTVVQMQDDGKEIRVKAGEVIELTLPGQAGTGYIWEFLHLNRDYFQVLQTETKSLSNPNRVGGPMLQIWRLKTLAPGTANLTLDYLRPWEGRSQAVKHFALQVRIQKGKL